MSNIAYRGAVTIKIHDRHGNLKHNETIHNEGLPELFSLICRTLASGSFNKTNRPYKLQLTDSSSNIQLLQPLITTNVFYGTSYEDSSEICTRLTFFLSYSAIKNTSGNYPLGGKILWLMPYNIEDPTTVSEAYAKMILPGTFPTMHSGDTISIAWELIFKNAQN